MEQDGNPADLPADIHPRMRLPRTSPTALCLCLGLLPFGCSQDDPTPQPSQAAPGTTHEARPASGSNSRGIDDPLVDRVLANKFESVNPEVDGWDTEVQNDLIAKRLKSLGHLWSRPRSDEEALASDAARDELARICSPEFRTTGLRFDDVPSVYEDQGLEVYSGASAKSRDLGKPGVAGMLEALDELRFPFAPEAELHFKFKVVEVDSQGDVLKAQALFQGDGASLEGAVQQSSVWNMSFDASNRKQPMLREVEVVDFTENRSRRGFFFEDCTLSAFGVSGNDSEDPDAQPQGLDAWTKQFGVDVENWLGGVQGSVLSSLLGHHGIAVGDVNGDGYEDVYVCQAGGLPNRLLLQQADGTVRDASVEKGVDFLDPSRGVLLIDIDNDGDQDLVLATSAVVVIFENQDGRGRFVKRSYQTFAQIHSMAAADYDGDGDLDLYGCAYKIPDGSGTAPVPYHDANNGEANVLLRNDIDIQSSQWTFTDVTQESGIDHNNRRFSFAASWEDYDNDGDLDLYVANDFGRNNLYRNEGGKFRDVAGEAGVEDISAGMGTTWGDVDNDGWMDLHVSNMFSSAGNRIAYQRSFKEDLDDSTLQHFRRHARGNSLFSNASDGTFRDVSLSAGITMGRWAWASKICDLNNDTRQDILVANGLVTNEQPTDL